MFVARERELALLENLYESGAFQMVPVWGRRRVGKTKLLNEFARGKARVRFFTARETTARENLKGLSAALAHWHEQGDAVGELRGDEPVYPSFEAALSAVFAEAQHERTLLVIDEYPYLASSYPGVSSLLQQLIDRYKDTSKLMLVLCGSSMSFMEHQVLGKKSPLYGRRTSQLKLEPWDFCDAAKMLGTNDPFRIIELYSLVGGIPLYLDQLDAHHDTEWNIAHSLLGQGRMLYAEPRNFLMQEVSSPAPYVAIIDALAHGRTRPAEVADATGIQSPNVQEHLRKLIELGVVRKDTPAGKANKRQVIYSINDPLFRFWHSFVPRYEQAIDLGQEERVASRIVQRDLSTYVGHMFEEVCRQWVARQVRLGVIDMLPTRIGSWWGTDPVAREQVDVDVVMQGSDGELLCGECKWTNDQVGADVVDTLVQRSRLVMDDPARVDLYVFSKSGFAPSAERAAQAAGNVHLVNAEALLDL